MQVFNSDQVYDDYWNVA